MRLAIASGIADLAIVLGDQDQHAIVDGIGALVTGIALRTLLAASDLPGLGHPHRIVLDDLGLGGRHDQDHKLRSLAHLERGQFRFESRLLGCRQGSGQIGHACRQRRHSDQRLGCRAACQQQGRTGREQQQPGPHDTQQTAARRSPAI